MAAAYEIQGRDASLFGSGPSGPATSGSLGLYIQGITTGGFSSVGGNTAGPSISNPTTNGSQALDSPLPTAAGPPLTNLTSGLGASLGVAAGGGSHLTLLLVLAVAVLAYKVFAK